MAPEERDKTEALEIYRLLFENWRFQIDSGWHRSSYFAAFETAFLLGVGSVIVDGYRIFGVIACVLGLALTVAWMINDEKVGSYIDYWWEAIKEIERKYFDSDVAPQPHAAPRNYASNYDTNAKERFHVPRIECPRYRSLMKLVRWLFVIAWLFLIGLALVTLHPHGHRIFHRWS